MITVTDVTFLLTATIGGMFALGIYIGYKLRKFVEKHT